MGKALWRLFLDGRWWLVVIAMLPVNYGILNSPRLWGGHPVADGSLASWVVLVLLSLPVVIIHRQIARELWEDERDEAV